MKKFYNLIPLIKRARGYRLYDYKGNRYLDLYQNNGHSILGHNTHYISKLMKNIISCGLISDLPSIYHKRIKKELKHTFDQYKSFLIFNSMEQAAATITKLTGKLIDKISDPVLGDIREVSFYRPFLPKQILKELFSKARILVPIFPFSIGGSPVIVCFKDTIANIPELPVSPLLLAGTLKSIYSLKKAALPEWQKNLDINNKYWNKMGLYIIPKITPKNYKKVFNFSLTNGILISPEYNKPSILPGEASTGEIKKMLGIFNKILDNM